ncbi:14 kDa phosphohistidine phosphatase [Chamberlinius hualienensis]
MASSSSKYSVLDSVADVDIDTGRFKYILIRLKDKQTNAIKKIVRGYTWAGYHVDIFEKVESELRKLNLDVFCVGGGRIEHNTDDKSISVYGYSQGYGRADHAITTDIIKKHYPDYKVTWSDEGY